ncbi:MAG: hypothetical protein ACRDKE_04245 [Solirubrobacterales bacterium]
MPVKDGLTPRFESSATRENQGSSSLINEAADLFDVPLRRRPVAGETDLIGELGERVEWLVERQRATRRAVDELSSALSERDRRIVELDAKLASFERMRGELLGRIDSLVSQIDRLSASAEGRES